MYFFYEIKKNSTRGKNNSPSLEREKEKQYLVSVTSNDLSTFELLLNCRNEKKNKKSDENVEWSDLVINWIQLMWKERCFVGTRHPRRPYHRYQLLFQWKIHRILRRLYYEIKRAREKTNIFSTFGSFVDSNKSFQPIKNTGAAAIIMKSA